MWLYPWLTYLAMAAIVVVVGSMYFIAGSRSQLVLSFISLAVVVGAYQLRKRRGVSARSRPRRGPSADATLCLLSAGRLRSALARGEVSAVEVLEAVLDRADRLSGPLNPFAVRLDERARTAAAAADAALARGTGGPLCGVPVTIKDSHYLAGVTAASGSRALADFVPAETSAAVERLEAAGAVIFAKTTTPEFCYFGITESPVNGRTSNPWDLERTPGGSSGGAGAAVAAGLGPLALGGDGGGSIRIPGGVLRRRRLQADVRAGAARAVRGGLEDARLLRPAGALGGRRAARCCGRSPGGIRAIGTASASTVSTRPPPTRAALRVVASEDLGFAPLDDDVRRGVPRCGRAARGGGRAGRSRTRPGWTRRSRRGRRSPRPRRGTRRPRSSSTTTRCSAKRPPSSWRTAAT